jgi:hypothetical protein
MSSFDGSPPIDLSATNSDRSGRTGTIRVNKSHSKNLVPIYSTRTTDCIRNESEIRASVSKLNLLISINGTSPLPPVGTGWFPPPDLHLEASRRAGAVCFQRHFVADVKTERCGREVRHDASRYLVQLDAPTPCQSQNIRPQNPLARARPGRCKRC